MDSLRSLPSQREHAAKKAYSTPALADLGAVAHLSRGGTAHAAETTGHDPKHKA
jgi:hypothetical protein